MPELSHTPARRGRPPKSSQPQKKTLPDWVDRLPEPIRSRTSKALLAFSMLAKPKSETDPDRPKLQAAAEKVERAWVLLQRAARLELGDGRDGSMSVSDWRAAVWATPEHRHAKAVWSYFAQHTPEYKAWKASYDQRRKKLIRAGVWKAAMAYDAAVDAYLALQEVYGCPGAFSRQDALRVLESFRQALEAYQKVGVHFCSRCNSRIVLGSTWACSPEDYYAQTDISVWIERARRTGREKAREGAYDARPAPAPRDDDEFVGPDPGEDEIEGVNVRYDHEAALFDDHVERQEKLANGFFVPDDEEEDEPFPPDDGFDPDEEIG